jgi:hypothetical protein
MTTIITNKTGAGLFNVTVMINNKEAVSFETTDMQLIDDISEMNDERDGSEDELMMHETFEEVIKTCLEKIS